MDSRTLAALKDAFAESNLPFCVDVIDWAVTSEMFKGIIEGAFEVVVSGSVKKKRGGVSPWCAG